MTITIKTHLNSGIYKSCGGGETRTQYEFATGPRNLARAVDQYYDHAVSMRNAYGNIGCGSTWIEIDGVLIAHMDLNDLRSGDDQRDYDMFYPCHLIKSRTQKCREFIDYVRSGQYAADQAAIAAATERGEY